MHPELVESDGDATAATYAVKFEVCHTCLLNLDADTQHKEYNRSDHWLSLCNGYDFGNTTQTIQPELECVDEDVRLWVHL